MTKTDAKGVALTAIAVLIAGLVMYYGKNLPVIKDARQGFDV